ncbi:two-component system sensor histidine kinase UhpB [Pseudarthrobacter sp. W1I19]|uniref:sensor histidine kinase n=1 Tax=Pseudarthrobacter sp. W1I19 TaxID=3042288 RepID=UPI002785160C|nr:ATP-binding protein [Pseudarthrobacter sp. W1I19]MDQ0925676.1 two-component system sensor histidine kinase UhpB [Pseudarthrobacter sp. W1I19]
MSQAPALDEVSVIGGIITDHRPLDLHALGVAGCIDRLADPLRHQGTLVRWDTPHHGIEITASSAALLYHAAQEALSNALKYAQASEITIRLAAVYHGIRLTVTDNGNGFDSTANDDRNRGFGLCLMSIAVHEAGGTITIDSSPGNGVRLAVTLPLD